MKDFDINPFFLAEETSFRGGESLLFGGGNLKMVKNGEKSSPK
jgi:hypothetical protein